MGQLFGNARHRGRLIHNFQNSVFPAVTFNCGPSTVSLSHTDAGNLSYMFCPLTALGRFDHTKGGHLILVNLKLYCQFPSGSTILIPSACLEHANTPIQEGETRLSLAQYAAGGLFRWVAYGFRSGTTLLKTAAGRREKEVFDKEEGVRWMGGLALFSKASELKADLEANFSRQR